MKLVDILARELKEWPANCTVGYCIQSNDTPTVFFGGLVKRTLSEIAEDSKTAKVTRAQWQAAVDALKVGEQPTWNGEGLPPLDVKCEAYFPYDTRPTWIPTVFRYRSDESVIYSGGENGEEIRKSRADFDALNVKLRPIRTAEQIEYDRKAEWVKAAIGILSEGAKKGYFTAGLVLSDLYDAGYRLQEQSK